MINSGGLFYIAGDICPTSYNEEYFSSGNAEMVFDQALIELFKSSKGLAFNLEVALSDNPAPIIKSGPCLIEPEGTINLLTKINPLCACLANNHITDSGKSGFLRTISALEAAGISYCGAGWTLGDMSKSFKFSIEGKTFALYACAEHEFTICEDGAPGANPFNPADTFADISELAKTVDSVIVLYHGMKEHYCYPSPEVRERCQEMVRAGAQLVCCQHSHCIGCMEQFQGSTILYGQGNFCFAQNNPTEMWRTGLLVSVVSHNQFNFIPVSTDQNGTFLLEGEEAQRVMDLFEQRSREIQLPGFVEKNWSIFCEENADSYAIQLWDAVAPRWMTFCIRVLRKLHLYRPHINANALSADLLNILQCEAHNEVLRTYIKDVLRAAKRSSSA